MHDKLVLLVHVFFGLALPMKMSLVRKKLFGIVYMD